MRPMLLKLLRDESGATAIEYGLIAALITLVIIAALTLMGSSVRNLFNYTAGSATTVWDHASQ